MVQKSQEKVKRKGIRTVSRREVTTLKTVVVEKYLGKIVNLRILTGHHFRKSVYEILSY